MHLFCCHTPAHRVLFEKVFAPSVPKGFELHSTLIEQTGPGDFLSPEFLRCIRRKLTLIQESLQIFKNEILVWSDVDIRFVNLSPRVLKADFESSNTDILFQRESPRLPDVNTGFFVCRANDPVRSLFDQVQVLIDENPSINEQMAMNQLLAQPTHPTATVWNYLPKTYYARTHGWPPPRKLALYHANYTKGPDAIGQKLAQFRELETLLHGGWPTRLLSIAKRIPRKLLTAPSTPRQ
jgi:hypothetical protein